MVLIFLTERKMETHRWSSVTSILFFFYLDVQNICKLEFMYFLRHRGALCVLF